MTKPHPLEPSTTLPYIHCPHCGMLIIGVVKSDKCSDKVLEDFGVWIKTEWVQESIKDYKEELRTKEREQG